MRTAFLLLVVTIVVVLMSGIGGVSADSETRVLRNQIELLRNELGAMHMQFQELQRRFYSDSKTTAESPNNINAKTDVNNLSRRLAVYSSRLDQIEQNQLRKISGKFDELNNLIDRMNARLEKLVADVDFRLAAIETNLRKDAHNETVAQSESELLSIEGAGTQVDVGKGYKPSGAPRILGTIPLKASVLEPSDATSQQIASSVLPDGTPEEVYEYAFNILQKAQYDKADQVLAAFIKKYPKHSLTENAAYWRGETFYARKMFGEAARVYALNLQRYENGRKAPDNMVKLAMALTNLKRTEEACQAFAELDRKFPDMANNISQAAKRGRSIAKCSD